MPMKPALKYGLVALGALATLSFVHWLREQSLSIPSWLNYLLGIFPNIAACVAIAYVLISIWAEQHPEATSKKLHLNFLIAAGFSGIGLVVWELFQLASTKLVFDAHDLGATLIGALLAYAIFKWLTPHSSPTGS